MLADNMRKVVQIGFNTQSFSLGETECVFVWWENDYTKLKKQL